jgi:tetratricopeptide (TPR) repeat protein
MSRYNGGLMKEGRGSTIAGRVGNRMLRRGFMPLLALLLTVFIILCAFASAQEGDSDYGSKQANYWYQRGLEHAGSGSYGEALEAYNKAIELDPENVGAWDGRALALKSLSLSERDPNKFSESLKSYDKSIELYEDKIEANPQDINALYYKGMALTGKALTMKAGEKLNISSNKEDRVKCFEDAIAAYDRAIEIDPDYVTAWKNKGNVLYSLGKYNESLEALNKALELVPDYGLAWYSKGLTLYEMGRYGESVAAYEMALKTFPENAGIWYNKGKALYDEGKYDAAIGCYDKAIKLNPSFAEAWHAKGVAFEKLGLDTSANAAFDKAKTMGYEG